MILPCPVLLRLLPLIAPLVLLTHAPCTSAADAPVSQTAPAAESADAQTSARTEFLWELDPYYSSIGLEIPLSRDALPDGEELREIQVYRELFRQSLRPRIMMLEGSVYPLPAAGAWLKSNHPDVYDDFDIGHLGDNQLNVLDGITAGFQEPWAISLFVGSAMRFSRKEEAADTRNRAYMGYLVSAGKKHIRNNTLIDDDWWEFEWKLKGERNLNDEELSWSFRAGIKNHGNPDIVDVAFVGLRRSNLDFDGPLLGIVANSNIELLTEVDQHSMRFLRQELTIGKKFPLPRQRFALSLDIGFIYEDEAKYRGTLVDPDADAFTLVFRPNIAF